jgi:hypothetical protein
LPVAAAMAEPLTYFNQNEIDLLSIKSKLRMLIMLVGRLLNDVVLTADVWYLSVMLVISFGEKKKHFEAKPFGVWNDVM